ncbi:MAG: penicillin-binding protein activator [Candidatus Goldiibacteriota bacterium]|jgi:ABC-type branched-subunit amino acid transport system substrate-binding protein
MKRARVIFLLFAAVFAAYMASGCVTPKIIKTADSALRDKNIIVSDDEFSYWKKFAKEGKDAAERSSGAFWCGQYHYSRKNYADALQYFEFNEKYYSDTDWGYLSIEKIFDIYAEKGDMDKACVELKAILEKRHQFAQFEKSAIERLDSFASKMKREQLKALYAKHVHKLSDEYALYYLCKADLTDLNYGEFYAHANAFLIDFRDSIFYADITAKYKESVKYKPVTSGKIGVIIPLTGKAMDIGADVKSGIELALAAYNTGKTPELKAAVQYFDEEDPKLEDAVVKAIEQDGILAFLGPLYSKTVKNLQPTMDKYNAVLFSSTAAQPDLTGNSPYFFRNCATARGQAYAAAKYMFSDTSYRNIATIFSDNTYGRILNDNFSDKFKSLGGNIVRQVSYDPAINDFQEQMVLLGGINTILLKEKRSNEKTKLDDVTEEAGKKILSKIFDFLVITPPDETTVPKPTPDPNMKKASICIVHLSPRGDDVTKLSIDDDMTKKLSYTLAKSPAASVIKQKSVDDIMSGLGVEPGDIDRETALNIGAKLNADVVVWGKITEEKTDTPTANFMPEQVVDSKGVTTVEYNFTEDDYFRFKITIYAVSVADETPIDETDIDYKKVKDPRKNPITIDALYIPATDRKMVLIKDQLKFYDFDLPVVGSSALASGYLASYGENVDGVIYPAEFYPEDPDPAVQEFVRAYKDKYAGTPDVIAAASYDAMNIACTVLDRGITSRENFRSILALVRNYDGATGMFSFDSTGDSVKDYYMMQIGKDSVKFIKKVTGE